MTAALLDDGARRVVIYVRISKDKLGREAGVTRQREACKAEATRRGWTVVDVVTDNDRSASEYASKARDGYARVCNMVATGSVDAVLAWSSDRLHRRPDELNAWIKSTHGKAATVYVQGGEADYASAAGKLMARQTNGFAAYESDVRHERVSAAMAQLRELGRWSGPPAFGWTTEDAEVAPGKWVARFTGQVDPVQGAAIRKACADVLAGVALNAIAREWTDAGLPTPRAGKGGWGSTNVRSILRRASNAALVAHRGQVVGPGNWEAIVDESMWRRVDALLANPSRRTATSTGNVHLGSGVYLCGVCSLPLRSSRASDGRSTYRCRTAGHVHRAGAAIDDLVVDYAVTALSQSYPVRLKSVGKTDPTAERDRLNAKMADLAADYADDAITRSEWQAARSIVQTKLDALAESVAPDPGRDLILSTGPLDVDGFMALPLASRRMIVARAMDVTVHRTGVDVRVPLEDSVTIKPKAL